MVDRWGWGAVFSEPPPPSVLRRLTLADNILRAWYSKARAEDKQAWERDHTRELSTLIWAGDCAERLNNG